MYLTISYVGSFRCNCRVRKHNNTLMRRYEIMQEFLKWWNGQVLLKIKEVVGEVSPILLSRQVLLSYPNNSFINS